MKPSRKFLSLPIISLSEGQHIGYVKNLVIDAETKSIAALIVDQKGFFKDQRIVPYSKVVSVGDDAITIDKGTHVEKSTNLPEILNLIKEKFAIIGTRVITQSGKTLGVIEEYFIDPEDGTIIQIEITGGKIEGLFNGKGLLDADHILTIGHDVIVTEKGCEAQLTVADKGINDAIKSLFHSTTNIASETSHAIGKYFKKDKDKEKDKALTFDDNDTISDYIVEAIPNQENSSDASEETKDLEELVATSEVCDSMEYEQSAQNDQYIDKPLTASNELVSEVPSKKDPLG